MSLALATGTTCRLLLPNEWPRLLEIPDGPFAQAKTLPDPLAASVVVVEDESGAIIGSWMVTSIMILEGLWLAPRARKQAGPARRLLGGMLHYLRTRQIRSAITVIQDPAVERLATKAGFEPIPGGTGTIYTLTLRDTEEGS